MVDIFEIDDPACTDRVVRFYNMPPGFYHAGFAETIRAAYLRNDQVLRQLCVSGLRECEIYLQN